MPGVVGEEGEGEMNRQSMRIFKLLKLLCMILE